MENQRPSSSNPFFGVFVEQIHFQREEKIDENTLSVRHQTIPTVTIITSIRRHQQDRTIKDAVLLLFTFGTLVGDWPALPDDRILRATIPNEGNCRAITVFPLCVRIGFSRWNAPQENHRRCRPQGGPAVEEIDQATCDVGSCQQRPRNDRKGMCL